ncbi:DUF6252 family protein [Pedobacter sp. WC2501]|uniref:DUF6252 family protein n=1 Tax=Pedobacter sp. WC2501 TaxID=3461400 RepID=UPI0040463E96
MRKLAKSKNRHYLKKLTLFIVCLISIMICAQCKKGRNLDPDGLPKATQIGAMVFACKINGQNWVSKMSRDNTGGGLQGDTLAVHGTNYPEGAPFEILSIVIKGLNSRSTFALNEPQNQYAEFISEKICSNSTTGNDLKRLKSSEGELVLTRIDRDKKIVSGTFWFNIPTDKCGNLKITDGRFDIQYN